MTLNKNLLVRKSTGFNGNDVTILAKNGFSSQSINAKVTNNSDVKESKWWILFLILGLGLVSILAYIMY